MERSQNRHPTGPAGVEFPAPMGHNGVAMNLVDLAIVVVIGLGILIGWKKGLVGPLLAPRAGGFPLCWFVGSAPPTPAGGPPSGPASRARSPLLSSPSFSAFSSD